MRMFRAEIGLPPGGDPIFEGQHSPDLVLAMFSEVLGKPQPDWPPNTRVTGFAFYDLVWTRPPDSPRSWLDSSTQARPRSSSRSAPPL